MAKTLFTILLSILSFGTIAQVKRNSTQYNRQVPLPSFKKNLPATIVKLPQSSTTIFLDSTKLIFSINGVATHTLTNYGKLNNCFFYTPNQKFEIKLGFYYYEDKTTRIVYYFAGQ